MKASQKCVVEAIDMIELDWNDYYHQVPEFTYSHMKIGTHKIDADETINFGTPVGTVDVRPLMTIPHRFQAGDGSHYQLALLVFAATRRAYALNGYFPLTTTLDALGQQQFYKLAGHIMRQMTFEVRFNFRGRQVAPQRFSSEVLNANPNLFFASLDLSEHTVEVEAFPETAFFVACHIAEIFFFRQDILEKLLSAPLRNWLYFTYDDFKQDGGAAGGNFSLEKGGIQLVLARLFEGFNDKMPGGAPFLHEFGHLLDHFDAAQGLLADSHGTLPGMRPDEGAIYNPKARELFMKGKRLEAERYDKLCQQGYTSDTTLPIGHPYVFQNDTEFVAGYFEMFFRNPHYFAQQNPDLYDSFVLTFGQDPRKAWTADFPFYIQQNQGFYQGNQRPPKHGLTI
jgi:hypothetical protein